MIILHIFNTPKHNLTIIFGFGRASYTIDQINYYDIFVLNIIMIFNTRLVLTLFQLGGWSPVVACAVNLTYCLNKGLLILTF